VKNYQAAERWGSLKRHISEMEVYGINQFMDNGPQGAAMHTNMLLNTSRRGVELQYVTTHFRDLQGLRLAPLWAALLALTGLATSTNLLRWQLAAMALTIILFSLGWLVWSGRWYERRYGVVRDPEPIISSGIISIMHPEAKPRTGNDSGFKAVYFLLVALWIVPELFARFDRGMGSNFSLMLVMFIVLPKCFYSASGNTLIRIRQGLSIGGSIFICGMFPSYLFSWLGKWPYLAAICTTLLLLDLYDHWLFTRLLRGESAKGLR
jgi:hypothetical protein